MKSEYSVVMLPGDGTGIDVSQEALRVLRSIEQHHEFSFNVEEIPCGGKYYLDNGRDRACRLRSEMCRIRPDSAWRSRLASPDHPGPVTMDNGKMAGYSAVIGNRLKLDLYANVRPVKLLPGIKHKISGENREIWAAKNVDMVFLRENTEGLYAGESDITRKDGVIVRATDTRVITRRACERILRMGFEIAQTRHGAPKDGVKKVTLIVKNNVLDGCRLFAEVFEAVGEDFPEITERLLWSMHSLNG